MGLDYVNECANFRDFGGYINLILDKKILPEGKLFRGGSIDYIKEHSVIENVKSVICLRNIKDDRNFDIDYYHFPMSNKIEKYDTTNKEVQKWLNSILKTFENDEFQYPVLIHCLSGKDRTGIVVTAILLILGVEIKTIEEEYMLSEGEVKPEWIRQAIEGMENVEAYFNQVDLEQIRMNLIKPIANKNCEI